MKTIARQQLGVHVRAILVALEVRGPMSVVQASAAVDLSSNCVRKYLHRMVQRGLASKDEDAKPILYAAEPGWRQAEKPKPRGKARQATQPNTPRNLHPLHSVWGNQ